MQCLCQLCGEEIHGCAYHDSPYRLPICDLCRNRTADRPFDAVRLDGAIWTCLNWKSLITFQKAAYDSKMHIESLMIWDKDWIGPGGDVGLRPCYEMVALLPMDFFKIPNRGLRDIQVFKWSSKKPNGHPAEKPETMMEFLIQNSTRPGDTVLDPFMGSGTVGVSALKLGRKYIGIEMDPNWFDVAAKRITATDQQTTLQTHSLRSWKPNNITDTVGGGN